MAVSEQVIVELIARTDALEREMRRTGQNTDRQLSAIESRFRQFGGYLTGILGGVSAAALVSEFLSLADASKSLDAQLRLATSGFGSFAKAQADVRRIAADTRSGLEETAALYGNFSRAAKEMGADQDAVARATETFSKTLKISGSDANQAASATLQFGQALAAGALRGDELNSVLEAAPRLARLLTESMGMPIGKIKELGEQGKLTSDVLLNALTNRKFFEGIDREAAELPVTFEQAMTQVNNAAIITFGAFDRGGQFSTALANFITQGSDGFADLEKDAVNFGIEVRSTIEGLASAFDPLIQAAKSAFSDIEEDAKSLSDRIRPLLGEIDSISRSPLVREGSLEQWVNKNLWGMDTGGGTNLLRDFNARQRASELASQRANGLTPVGRVLGKLSDANRSLPDPNAPKPTASGPSDADKRKVAAAQRKAEAEARKAEQERLRAIRDEASSARESAQLEDDINAAKAALATATEDVLRYQLDAIESERKQQVADIETQVKLGKLSREEADRRILVNSELAGLRGDLVKRRAAEADAALQAARYRDEANTLQVESQLINSREARRDVEMRILDLAYKEEEASIRRAAANGEIADLDEALANMRRRQAAETEGTRRASESPLEQRRRQARDTADNLSDAIEAIELNAVDELTDGLARASTEFLHLGGVAGDVLNSIINDFIRLAAQQAIFGSLGGGSGGGSLLGGLGKLFGIAGARAGGGPVSGGQTYLVGENGPELFRAPSSGTIVPNHQLNATAAASMTGVRAAVAGATTSVTQVLKFDLRSAVVTEDLLAEMNQMAQQAAIQGAQGGRALAARDLKAMGRPRM